MLDYIGSILAMIFAVSGVLALISDILDFIFG